ncbi:MAG TPA: response regulator [candidate division Zixibacteria bacterium]|nr:response regulator [candidate division Zixibacteria bacterium]
MRALVVDDSSTMRAVLRIILRRKAFEVHEAKNGAEAMRTLEAIGPVDLMLLDWNMPEMNGFELLSCIRRDSRHTNTKIMMVTTETALDEMSRALEAGANEYIMKPFTPDAVDDKLRMLGW